jgi:hypothetical protein
VNLNYAIVGFVLFLASSGCCDSTQPIPGPHTELLYSNTFENPADSVGWQFAGNVSIFFDSSKVGGNKCLQVSGSDVVPHARMLLDTLWDSGEVILRFDGRCIERPGGSVVLTAFPFPPYLGAYANVLDTVWHSYVDTASFPAGFNLVISIDGNGLFGTPVLVDNIEVLRIVR